jgi:hypothetical protein
MKTDEMYLQKVGNKQKTFKNTFFVDILSATEESQWYGSADPDPYRTMSRIHNTDA